MRTGRWLYGRGLAMGLIAAAALACGAGSARAEQLRRQIVGYVFPQNRALQAGEIDGRSLTRINYAFANIENGRIVTGFSADAQNFAYLVGLKRDNPELTVLVSVGGWLWSTNFSDVSLTRQSRSVFVASVVEFVAKYNLDGLDVDWEYPGMPGAGHPFKAEDRENFTLLLKELRTALGAEGRKAHRRMVLTIAAGASDEFLAHTEMKKVAQIVDTVNLMTYDFYEPGSDAIAGHHAPLYTNPADPKHVSSDTSVRAFEQAGVPAGKILLGMPFYGHVWGQVADKDHGLYQPGKPLPDAYAPYHKIADSMLNHGYERYWDAQASAPYLYNPEKQIFVSYEDPESIKAKCGYIVTKGLGGAMFWEYGGDSSEALLGTIHSACR